MTKKDLLDAYDKDNGSIQFSACIAMLKQVLYDTEDRVFFLLELRDFILDFLERENIKK